MFSKIIFEKSKNIFKVYWPLLLILLLASFLRFYNATNRYSLGYEAIRDVTVGMYGAEYLQFPLTGPFSSLGAFTFGPWYWYLLILGYLLLPTSYAAWIVMSLLSVGQVFFMYQIGKLLKDKHLAIILGTLSAVAPYLVDTSTALSNPNPLHFFAATSIYFFLRALSKKSHWIWSFLMGLSIGIGFFSHYQMLAYLSFPLILIAWKRFNIKHLLGSGTGLFVTYIPMLMFDLLNDWHQVRNILFSYTDMGNRIYIPNSWKLYLFDFWPQSWSHFWYLPYSVGLVFLAAVVVGCFYLLYKKQFNRKIWILTGIWFLMFIHLRYYKGSRFMGYVHYTFPFLILYTGLAFYSLKELFKKKYIYMIALVAFCVGISPDLVTSVQSSNEVSEFNRLGKALTSKYPDKQYTLYHCGTETNEEDTLSTLFILEKENLLSDSGQIITVGETSCRDQLKKTIYTEIDLSEHGFKIDTTSRLFLLEEATLEDLEQSGFKEYSFETLYPKYALWWFESTLN